MTLVRNLPNPVVLPKRTETAGPAGGVEGTAPIQSKVSVGGTAFDTKPVTPTAPPKPFASLDVGRLEGKPIYPGINEMSADWARTRVLTHAVLNITQGSRDARNLADLEPALERALTAHGFSSRDGEVDRLLQRMVVEGVIDREGNTVKLGASARAVAMQSHASGFIRADLTRGLKQAGQDPLARDTLRQALTDYAGAAALWPLDPVEGRGGLFKAIAKMSEPDRAALKAFIDSEPDLRKQVAVDDVRLMLDPLNPPADWVERNTPNLKGRMVVMGSIEDDLEVGGGLGRVFGYESERMNRLLTGGAATLPAQDKPRFTTISPMYDYRFSNTGVATPLDYGQKGVTDLKQVRQYDRIDLEDDGIARAQIFTGQTPDGIQRIFVKDPDGRHTAALYQYERSAKTAEGKTVTAGDWEDAVDFFGSAAAGYLRELANTGQIEQGDGYRGMVVQGNDGQSALLAAYLANDRVTEDGGGVDKVFVTAKTHTINNRGPDVIAGWNLPERMNDLSARVGSHDPTSLMLRSGTPGPNGRPIAQAVSSVHAAQMRVIDPGVDLYAVTNGTRVDEYQRRFLSVLPENERPKSPAEATAQQLTRARELGKQQLAAELNGFVPPNLRLSDDEVAAFKKQMLVAFSGRGVDEKIGASENQVFNDLALQEKGDRTTPRNIEAMLKKGINVVLYANAQAFPRSQEIFAGLTRLQEEYAAARPGWAAEAATSGGPAPGRLIVRTGWGPEEQWRLHAAADVSVQVSDSEVQGWSSGVPVKTEANGATEVPDLLSGNLKLTTPEIHGGMNTLTELVSWDDPKEGSVIVPDEYSAKGFLDSLLKAQAEFQNPERAAERRLTAFREARSTDSIVTAAADLRLFDKVVTGGAQK